MGQLRTVGALPMWRKVCYTGTNRKGDVATQAYTLVRSRRRTLAISVGADGALVAHAPLKMPLKTIEGFIAQKQGWIEKKQAEMAQKRAARRCVAGLDGERVPYLGGVLLLRHADVASPRRIGSELLLPQASQGAQAVRSYIEAEAKRLLPPRVAQLAASMGVRPASLAFSHAKTRWGSMRTDGCMRLNVLLPLCPIDVIDYIIIHELCHIRHPDHSPAFWHAVEAALPGMARQRAWLKRNADLIRLFD